MKYIIILSFFIFASCNIIHPKHTQTNDEYVDVLNYKLRLYGKWKIQYARHEITVEQYIILLQDEVDKLNKK